MSLPTFPQFPMFPPRTEALQSSPPQLAAANGVAPMVEFWMLASNDMMKLNIEWSTALAGCRTPAEAVAANARFVEQSWRLAMQTANRASESAKNGADAPESKLHTAEWRGPARSA